MRRLMKQSADGACSFAIRHGMRVGETFRSSELLCAVQPRIQTVESLRRRQLRDALHHMCAWSGHGFTQGLPVGSVSAVQGRVYTARARRGVGI